MLCNLLDKAAPLLGGGASPALATTQSDATKMVARLPLEKLKQWNVASVASALASPHTPHTAHTPHTQDSPHYLNPTAPSNLPSLLTDQLSNKSQPTSHKFISDVNMSSPAKTASG